MSKLSKSDEFPTITDAIPALIEGIKKSRKKKIKIDIIAATGSTTVNTLLPALVQACPDTLFEIVIHVINPVNGFQEWIPHYWVNETTMVIEKIKTELRYKSTISIYNYNNFPNIHGIMINKNILVIGFFGWRHYYSGKKMLSGAHRPHLYFSRNQRGAEYFFDLFEDWFENSPKNLVFSSGDSSDNASE